MRKLILFAYANTTEYSTRLCGTSARTIRGYAATLAFKGTAPVEDLMKACSWKSRITFTSFYLKVVSGQIDDLLGLGLLAVAQIATRLGD